MKSMLIVLVVVAIVTMLVFGFSIPSPQGDASGVTGQFLLGGSLGLGLEIILILVVLFTAYSLLKRQVVEY